MLYSEAVCFQTISSKDVPARKHPEDPKTTEARVKALDYLQELGGMEGGEMCSDVM